MQEVGQGSPSDYVSSLQEMKIAFFHAAPKDIFLPDKFRFCFVRHPLTWYQSQWAFHTVRKWRGNGEFVRLFRSDHFNEFVHKCTESRPGLVSAIYKKYDAVSFVGKYESLAADLVKALHMAHEDFDEQALRATTPKNVRAQCPDMWHKCQYTEELKQLVLESEHEAIEKYGYSELAVSV